MSDYQGSYPGFAYTIKIRSRKNKAKIAEIVTPHGKIRTPAFIFCATKGTMKGTTTEYMKENNTQIILSNTYHLEIYPGSEEIERMGGLHKITNWSGPMLTDSGGYQVFAMGHGSVSNDIGSTTNTTNVENAGTHKSSGEIKGNKSQTWKPTLNKITEKGAHFRSYLDSSKKVLTPERSIQIQRNLGADIILVFDECTSFHHPKEYHKTSMERSHRWATRSVDEFNRTVQERISQDKLPQALYGIVQGCIYKDLRTESIEFNNNNNFFGVAIGGSLGDSKESMYDTVEFVMNGLRDDRPVHLLGIGNFRDIFFGVKQGIDTFDCVHPSRIARHGGALVKAKYWIEENNSKNPNKKEHIDLTKGRFKKDSKVIDSECACSTCRSGEGYSREYIHMLFKMRETTAGTLVTNHNVFMMNQLMEDIRNAIESDTLDQEEKNWVFLE